MKTKHLIAELQKFDPELEVITEGCDCIGDTAFVTLENFVMDFGKKGQCVYINRSKIPMTRSNPKGYDNSTAPINNQEHESI